MTGLPSRRPAVAGFAIFTLLMVMAFAGLGIWQLQRRVEKHALIAILNERLAAEPAALPARAQWSTLTPAKDEFRRVSFTATYAPLPVLLAVLVGLAPQTRLYRSFFLDEISQDYVRTARAKGLTEKTVLLKHVLRNAMIPILTNVAVALPGIFVGSFLIEVFFSIPGLGREILLAVNRSDYPVIQAFAIYIACITMVVNLATDVLYTLVDPRVVLR